MIRKNMPRNEDGKFSTTNCSPIGQSPDRAIMNKTDIVKVTTTQPTINFDKIAFSPRK